MENVAPSQDILVKERAESHGTTTRDTSDQSESKEIDTDSSVVEQETNAHKKRHKSATKSLCIHLTLFAAFKNPKALYKESEVRQLFLRFLAHREGEVQKLAVKCLMTYKFGYLQPYKENIERLLDDENFRDELAHFSVDEESGIVDTSHREGLMPVLIRSVMTRDILLQVGSGGFSLFRPCAFVFGKLALVAVMSVGHLKWRGFKNSREFIYLGKKNGSFLIWKSFSPILMKGLLHVWQLALNECLIFRFLMFGISAEVRCSNGSLSTLTCS